MMSSPRRGSTGGGGPKKNVRPSSTKQERSHPRQGYWKQPDGSPGKWLRGHRSSSLRHSWEDADGGILRGRGNSSFSLLTDSDDDMSGDFLHLTSSPSKQTRRSTRRSSLNAAAEREDNHCRPLEAQSSFVGSAEHYQQPVSEQPLLPFSLRLDAVPLVGRSQELATLKQALERVHTGESEERLGGASELILVSGEPGTGKSALVNQLRKRQQEATHRPLFALGKFDQEMGQVMLHQHHAPPYSAFVECFENLVTAILALRYDHPAVFKKIVQRLQVDFGRVEERSVLESVISNLDFLLFHEEIDISGEETIEEKVEGDSNTVNRPKIGDAETRGARETKVFGKQSSKTCDIDGAVGVPSTFGENKLSQRAGLLHETDVAIDTTHGTTTADTNAGDDEAQENNVPVPTPNDSFSKTRRWAEMRASVRGTLPGDRDSALSNRSGSSQSASLRLQMREQTKVFEADRTKNVLYYLSRKFVRAVSECAASEHHPVVLVVEDLQWADPDSLDLLNHLATDRESSGVLFVGCYRDNNEEQATNGALQKFLDAITSNDTIHVTEIKVSNLSIHDVQEYLEEMLSSDSRNVKDLAAVIHQKTRGNAFFIRQFITTIVDDELMKFNIGTVSWQFDVELIRSETSIADNVVALVTHKIQAKLPQDARFILQLASCLGSSFEEGTLAVILNGLKVKSESSSGQQSEPGTGKPLPFEDGTIFVLVHGIKSREAEASGKPAPSVEEVKSLVSDCLNLCVAEGLLEFLGGVGDENGATLEYRFAHDHIQIATYTLVGDEEKGRLQLLMGEILADKLPEDDDTDDQDLFIAADLLNRGIDHIPEENLEKRLSLVQLNLRAGKRATSVSAFSSALAYLRAAISVLRGLGPPHEYWKLHTDLCLDVFGLAADASFCRGILDEMQDYIDEVLVQDSLSFVQKVRAYSTHVRSLGIQNNLPEAINTSMFLIRKLGIRMPTNPSQRTLFWNLVKTKKMLDKYDAQSLLELPLMEDETMMLSMRIMDSLLTYAYAANPDLLVLLILKMTRRSVKYGLAPSSPTAFGGFANLVGSILGDYRKGNMYARVCLALNKKMGLRSLRARSIFVAHNFALHWNDPLPQSFKPYLHGYRSGLESGDLENAMFCITYHCDVAMHTGRRLSTVVADFAAYTRQMKDFELEYNCTITLVPWQLALNLMGDCPDHLVLTGKAMDQDTMLAAGKKIPFLCAITNAARLCLACLYGDYELAWEMVEATQGLAKTNLGQSVVWRSSLFEGLTIFSLARKTGGRVWRRRAAKVMQRVKVWVSGGNLNCVHIMYLLKAEKASLERCEEAVVRKAYDLAISSASRIGFSNDQALANERAGIHFASSGENGAYWSKHYFESAYRLYNTWEAYGKSKHLKASYPKYLPDVDR